MSRQFRGWECELKDGTIIREGQCEWRDVSKRDIIRLSLLYNGKKWDLMNKEAYFVKTRASMVPGVSESLRIEARMVGFYEGNKKVHYIVDELTGRFEMKVEEN